MQMKRKPRFVDVFRVGDGPLGGSRRVRGRCHGTQIFFSDPPSFEGEKTNDESVRGRILLTLLDNPRQNGAANGAVVFIIDRFLVAPFFPRLLTMDKEDEGVRQS